MRYHKFSNGLVLLYEKNKYSKKDSFQIHLKFGSLIEPKNKQGITHLVEHMIFKSTSKMSTQEISTEFEQYGADMNAWTDYTNVRHYFDVLPEFLPRCIQLQSEMIFDKQILTDDFQKERDVVCQEIRNGEDDFAGLNFDYWYEHNLGWKPIAGTVKSVKNIDVEDVNNFINTYYTPNNMVISVCSHLSYGKIYRLVKKYFGNRINVSDTDIVTEKWKYLEPTKNDYLGYNLYDVTKKDNILVNKKTVNQSYVLYGLELGNLRKTLDCSLIYVDFIGRLLTYGLSSILYRKLREELGLCYNIHVVSSNFIMHEGNHLSRMQDKLFIVSCMENKNVKKFADTLVQVLHDIVNNTTKEDVKRAINQILSNELNSFECASFNIQQYFTMVDKSPKAIRKSTSLAEATKEIEDGRVTDLLNKFFEVCSNPIGSFSIIKE